MYFRTIHVAAYLTLALFLVWGGLHAQVESVDVFVPKLTGPVRQKQDPDLMVENYSAALPAYRSINGVKVSARIVPVDNPLGKKGLLVELPATGLRGRRGIEIDLPMNQTSADWRKYTTAEFWLTYPKGSSLDMGNEGGVTSRIEFTIVDAKGEWFTQVLKVRPYLGGRWQPMKVELNNPWRHKKRKLPDFSNIKRIQIFTQANIKYDIAYTMSGIGLSYIDQKVPCVSVEARDKGFLFQPGQPFVVQVVVDSLKPDSQAQVVVEGLDYQGKKLWDKVLSFDGKSGTKQEQELSFPNPTSAYVDVSAVLSVNGRKVFQAFRGLASLPPLTAEQDKYRKSSIFSVWPRHIPSILGDGYTRKFLCIPKNYSDIDSGLWRPPSPPERNLGIACVGAPPFWNKGWLHKSYTEKQYEEFAGALEAAVKRIKPGTIPYYEVINEPNAKWWGPMEDLVRYHRLVADAIRRGDPNAKVGGPCPYGIDLAYLERFFKAGGAECIDFVDVHGYHKEAEFQQRLQALKELMTKYGIGDQEILITEKGDSIPSVTAEEQARSLVRAYVIALVEGVKVMVWHAVFNDIDQPGDRAINNKEPDFNILRADGSANPAFVAYGMMTRTLLGATYKQPVAGLPEGCVGYEFAGPQGRKILVLWKFAAGVTQVQLPVAGADYWQELMGKRHPLGKGIEENTFSLTPNPIYIVW